MVAKMLNQLIVGCGYAVMAEAAVLAEAAGIDASRLPECLRGGHADGSLLQRIYPRMVKRDFAPQGYARQLLKDLEMVNEFAGGMKAPTPMMGRRPKRSQSQPASGEVTYMPARCSDTAMPMIWTLCPWSWR